MKAWEHRKCSQSKETVDLRMWLYTRNNPEEPEVFKYNEAGKLKDSNFNPSKLTRMVVHGFGGDCNLTWIVQMRRDLLNESDINLFCADWRKGTIYPDYGQGAANTQIAGKMIAIFFNNVSEIFEPIGPNLHLIGFSFGAQVCSFAGSNIPNCNRITGLDPAGPSFREHNKSFRLDKTDADFVDMSLVTLTFILLEEKLNHIVTIYLRNFYWDKTLVVVITEQYIYFWKSIINDNCKMIGFPCPEGFKPFHLGQKCCFEASKSFPLGLNTPRNATGKLYLKTRTSSPYCMDLKNQKLLEGL
ncbi:unnamed protein product [Lepeophtheirus salmonis]|uniref:(salmon louse) hypothetical protein n=1 Tax=Lepeophtheirus salmonis TaxID=72036 RepID=A0A7R8D0U3_LEPSM|nr:unnamed protein product [Lepeophtheirus salmonis]CAF2964379.1 unnamed protein product [Lepeophtheirus salmonis]